MPERDIQNYRSESNLEFDPDIKMSTLTQQYQNSIPANSLPPLSQMMSIKQDSGQFPLYQAVNDSPRSSFQMLVGNHGQPDLSPNLNPYNQVPITAYSYPQLQKPLVQQQQQAPIAPQGFPPPPPQLDSTHLFEKCTCRSENNHIPRPRNAFILFRQRNHQALLDEGNVIRTNPDVSRELGRRWRNLSPKEKEYWNKCAEDEKKRHAEKYPGYKYSPRRNSKKNCPSCKAKIALRNHNLNIQSYLAQYPNSSLYPNQPSTVLTQPIVQQHQQQQQQLLLLVAQQPQSQNFSQPMVYSNHFVPQQQQQQLFNDISTHPYYVDQTTAYVNSNGSMTMPQQLYVQNPPLHSVSPVSNASHNSAASGNQTSTSSLGKPDYRLYRPSSTTFKAEGNASMVVNKGRTTSPQMAHPHLPSISNLTLPPPFNREK